LNGSVRAHSVSPLSPARRFRHRGEFVEPTRAEAQRTPYIGLPFMVMSRAEKKHGYSR